MTPTIAPTPASPRPFAGLGVEADCFHYDDNNRQCGVNEADHAMLEARLKALRPGIARVFLSIDEFNPSLDGKTYTWDTPAMGWQLRNLRVLREAGASVNLCMGPWTNREMMQDGKEQCAVDLLLYLRREQGLDHICWLTLFNEPESFYLHDSPLCRQLMGDRKNTRPWSDYVAKHRHTQTLLEETGLYPQVRLVVTDTVWGAAMRLERLQLSGRDFAGLEVGHSFHHYAAGYPEFYSHADSAPFAPPPLDVEMRQYREAVGLDSELVCWEFNSAGFGFGHAWPGIGPRGEDHAGTFETAVHTTRTVLGMLAAGIQGVGYWCAGDVYYRNCFPQHPMQFGLWRYKWNQWTPRPIFFYYAALVGAFRPGATVHAVSGLPPDVHAAAARDAHGWTLALLNAGPAAPSVALPPELGPRPERLRVTRERLPLRPDSPARPCPDGDRPLHAWEPIAPNTPTTVEPGELTILRPTVTGDTP